VVGGIGAGTDQAAGGVTISTGRNTGAGTSDALVQTGFTGATGSSLQTAYDRVRITSKTKTLSNTTATNTVFCLMSNTVTDSGVGCMVQMTLEILTPGTHSNAAWSGTAVWACVNQNGACTAGGIPVATSATSSAANGGITVSSVVFTSVVSGTSLQLGITPSFTGSPTTVRLTYMVLASGQTTITPQ
jgi:hypothetical protein